MALWHAAQAGDIDTCRELLEQGENPNRSNGRTLSPLHWVRARGSAWHAGALRSPPPGPHGGAPAGGRARELSGQGAGGVKADLSYGNELSALYSRHIGPHQHTA